MNQTYKTTWAGACLLAVACGAGLAEVAAQTQASVAEEALPRVFAWRPAEVAEGRRLALAGDPTVAAAVAALCENADEALDQPVVHVMQKDADHVALSGDPHDYTSVSVYLWPDPADPDAAWVMHDGKRNHEAIDEFDGPRMSSMCTRVIALSQAYYFTDDERYARTAADQLRAWFNDPATRMNPHMDYAQFIPNKNKGSFWGIIDFNRVPELLSGVGMIAASDAWTDEDHAAMQKWCADFAVWMQESENGKKERAMSNNHGVFYDFMLASLAMFCEDTALAHRVLADVPARRIAVQIEPDGALPHELKRPDASMYAAWTLYGYLGLATLAEQVDVDLWGYETADGRSIREAVAFTLPYLEGQKEWTWGKAALKPKGMHGVMWRAAKAWPDGPFERVLTQTIWPAMPEDRHGRDAIFLLSPPGESWARELQLTTRQ